MIRLATVLQTLTFIASPAQEGRESTYGPSRKDFYSIFFFNKQLGWVGLSHLRTALIWFKIFPFALLFLCPLCTAKPNIIFILADDLGYGDVGAYNPDSKIPTPNLDRMAAEGLRFTDGHSPDAVCTPSRYAYLTGRYCWRSRLKSGVLGVWAVPLLEPDRITVPEMLKGYGYRTACVGKWHLGWNWPDSWNTSTPQNEDWAQLVTDGPLTSGFDYYFGDDVPNYPPYAFIENDSLLGSPSVIRPAAGGMEDSRAGPALAGWDQSAVMPAITAKAVEWLRANADSAFYLHFTLTAPHTPIAPAEQFLGTSQAGVYGDFVYEVDWAVGEVLDAVRELGLEENTLVFFSADNGTERFIWDRITEFDHNSSGPLRGCKRDSWEGGHRVPTMAWWPGIIDSGSVSDETICFVDMFATYASLLGYTLPDDAAEDSYDLLPLFLGNTYQSPLREGTVHHSHGNGYSIRQGRWKFIDGKGSNGGNVYNSGPNQIQPDDPPGQLYDMNDDIGESNNLYEAHPDTVAALKALLESYKSAGRSVPTNRPEPKLQLKLLSPAGGEGWQAGSMQELAWYLAGGPAMVRLDYSLDGGVTWFPIAESVSAEMGKGTHSWQVVSAASVNVKIRVSTLDGNASDENEVPLTTGTQHRRLDPGIVSLKGNVIYIRGKGRHHVLVSDLRGSTVLERSGKGPKHYALPAQLQPCIYVIRVRAGDTAMMGSMANCF